MLVLGALAVSAAWLPMQAQVKLVVQGTDGAAVETPLSDIRTLQFQQDGFRLNGWDGKPMQTFSFAKVRKLVFANETTGIGDVSLEQPELKARVNDRMLQVEGWTPDAPAALAVYAVSGRCVYRDALWNGESVSLSGLPAGVYLLTVNQETLKFILR